jgi:hypothetical protein
MPLMLALCLPPEFRNAIVVKVLLEHGAAIGISPSTLASSYAYPCSSISYVLSLT